MACVLCFITSPLSADAIGKTDKKVKAIAGPILDNILEGLKTNDYVKYSRDFDKTLKEAISEKRFLEIDRDIKNFIGNCKIRRYLGFLTKGKMTLTL